MTDPRNVPPQHGGEHRLQQLADSAILKVIQYAITGIAVPLIGYGLNSIADRLSNIDRAVASFNTTAATTELRIRNLETLSAERSSSLRSVQDKITGHEFRIQRLEELNPPRK